MSELPRKVTKTHGQKVRKVYWGFAFRCIVTALIIAYLTLKVHWSELIVQLGKANIFWLMVACFLFGVVYLLAALRWWFLMQVQGIHLPFKVVTALTLIGQFFNSFLLGAVGGDIIKAVYIQKYAPNQKTHATLSIIMDRVLGLLILICASLLVIPWQFQYLLLNDQAISVVFGLLVIFGLCGAIGLVIVVTPFHLVPPRVRAMWHKIPHRHIFELVIAGFRQHGVALNLTLASLAAGIVMTAVLVAAGYCIGVGIGLTVTYLQMLVIMTVVICVISLPISIGGHGVREGVFVIMFAVFGLISVDQQFGAGQETAILFSLLFFAIPLVWSLVGGIVYLSFRHNYDLADLRNQR
jgi:uncharacterized protein (TIRG00374 family)